MKPVLYVAASLMIGASIYGFVGYSDAKQSREFKNMYHESDDFVNKEETEPRDEKVARVFVSKKEDISEVEPAPKTESRPSAVKAEKKLSKKLNRKKKIDYKSFSRAPLREERLEYDPDLKVDTTSN